MNDRGGGALVDGGGGGGAAGCLQDVSHVNGGAEIHINSCGVVGDS